MGDFSPMEWLKFMLDWARENKIGPLQTVFMVGGVMSLVFFSRFVRGAKRVVNDVHHVYEQALRDEKQHAARLREELDRAIASRRALADELEAERKVKEDLLRTLARLRAKMAAKPASDE